MGSAVQSSGGKIVFEEHGRDCGVFGTRSIPLAINHCVSVDPPEDSELEINRIDFLLNRYPDNTVGYSTPDYSNSTDSMLIPYAKGGEDLRAADRHRLRWRDGLSMPLQVDEWFKAFQQGKTMRGGPGTQLRVPTKLEVDHLEAQLRGVYAKANLPDTP
jgi:hypothetical protein